jgi:DNA-binding NarL/FixJ family response regulator
MPNNLFSVLVVSAPGRLRESLKVLLSGSPNIDVAGVAEDLASAFVLLWGQPMDMVMIDANLPGEDAWPLLHYVVATRPETRCLFLANDPRQKQAAEEAGANVVLIKGFQMDELYSVFFRLLPIRLAESLRVSPEEKGSGQLA